MVTLAIEFLEDSIEFARQVGFVESVEEEDFTFYVVEVRFNAKGLMSDHSYWRCDEHSNCTSRLPCMKPRRKPTR